jgi:Ulp1 family protease
MLVYPPTGLGGIEIMASDYRRLEPGEYFNDTLVEFGTK